MIINEDDVVFLPVPGPPGPPGAGDEAALTATAATALSGHRVVRTTSDGRVTLASNTNAADALTDLWLTTSATDAGELVTLHAFGRVSEPSWSWQPGPIWLGTAGVLTQTMPTGVAFLRQIGSSAGPTAMFYNPQPALVLV